MVHGWCSSLSSPWAKSNFVDHTVTDQTSILRFVEDNWLGSERIGQGSFDAIANRSTTCLISRACRMAGPYLLDPTTGTVLADGNGFGGGYGKLSLVTS